MRGLEHAPPPLEEGPDTIEHAVNGGLTPEEQSAMAKRVADSLEGTSGRFADHKYPCKVIQLISLRVFCCVECGVWEPRSKEADYNEYGPYLPDQICAECAEFY